MCQEPGNYKLRSICLGAILFHTIGNSTAALLPPTFALETGRWVYFGILLITTLVVIVVWSWQTLNRGRTVPRPSLPEST